MTIIFKKINRTMHGIINEMQFLILVTVFYGGFNILDRLLDSKCQCFMRIFFRFGVAG
jgi:hypothetical protein